MSHNIYDHVNVSAELDNWSISIRLDKRDAAASIHDRLKGFSNDFSIDTLIDFFLLESRFYLMQKHLVNSAAAIDNAKKHLVHFKNTHKYYLHLAEGILFYDEKHYPEALNCFEKAEKYLNQLNNPVEIGEFHLRKAMTYYFLDITTLSALHAERAIESLKPYKTFEFLLARAEMLQGMNYMDLHNFEMSEEHLHRALASYKNIDNQSFITTTNLNLGLLYVQRELPETAIRYLEEARMDKQERIHLKILYLLADSYWKTNESSKAVEAYTEGFQKSIENDNLTMKWEFAMLHKKYEDRMNYESVWQEGIEYFRKINDFFNVRLYSKELAWHYTETKQYELATRYYLLASI
ncbi:response regulator aspartate phosphatase C [Terribacillus aidingensis]|uniref:Response regulator aspartate phosphatase C n=1 Tax=Terribacillus aidingensis TaxID=586416 RepID=A0A285P2Z8_9BACI|nr:tetratricopeptide repeat protein [Terribacillus aidingensis]SNZ16105.1 response regulator aspartate phosphatase C [Terribacillus aidingensis]